MSARAVPRDAEAPASGMAVSIKFHMQQLNVFVDLQGALAGLPSCPPGRAVTESALRLQIRWTWRAVCT
jgi:hypothetical protein